MRMMPKVESIAAESVLTDHLEAAAQAFFADGDPDVDAPSTGNRFVHLAERAYYAERGKYLALRTRPELPGPTTKRFWLYRLFDRRHRLLYVGITANPNGRLRAHRKRFGELLDHWTLEEYDDQSAVLEAETRAIDLESPAFNAQHPYTG